MRHTHTHWGAGGIRGTVPPHLSEEVPEMPETELREISYEVFKVSNISWSLYTHGCHLPSAGVGDKVTVESKKMAKD